MSLIFFGVSLPVCPAYFHWRQLTGSFPWKLWKFLLKEGFVLLCVIIFVWLQTKIENQKRKRNFFSRRPLASCLWADRSIQNCLIIMKPDDVIMVWLHKVTLFNSLIFWFLLSVGAYKHMGAISPCVYSIVSASNIKLWQDGSTQCGLWNVWWLLKFAEMWQCLYKIARLSQCKQWIFLNQ